MLLKVPNKFVIRQISNPQQVVKKVEYKVIFNVAQ